jgi:hypothetical protein
LGSANRRQAEGVVEVAFPEALQLPGSQEPELDRFGVGLLKEVLLVRGQARAPLGRVGGSQCFT